MCEVLEPRTITFLLPFLDHLHPLFPCLMPSMPLPLSSQREGAGREGCTQPCQAPFVDMTIRWALSTLLERASLCGVQLCPSPFTSTSIVGNLPTSSPPGTSAFSPAFIGCRWDFTKYDDMPKLTKPLRKLTSFFSGPPGQLRCEHLVFSLEIYLHHFLIRKQFCSLF